MDALDPSSYETRSILRFRIGDARVALFAEHVEQVLEPSELTPIPCAPKHVPGLVAVRGEALPVFDLATFLGLAASHASEVDAREPRLLLVRSSRYRVGVPCAEVSGVAALPTRAFVEPVASRPPALRRHALFEVTVDGAVTPVLDLDALLEAGRA
jgi:chemotaxis signal transduction protein